MNARRISNGLTRAHSKDITDGRIKLQGFVYILTFKWDYVYR